MAPSNHRRASADIQALVSLGKCVLEDNAPHRMTAPQRKQIERAIALIGTAPKIKPSKRFQLYFDPIWRIFDNKHKTWAEHPDGFETSYYFDDPSSGAEWCEDLEEDPLD